LELLWDLSFVFWNFRAAALPVIPGEAADHPKKSTKRQKTNPKLAPIPTEKAPKRTLKLQS
jgi:hypothetical protein